MPSGTNPPKRLRNLRSNNMHQRILFTCDYFWPYVGGAEISSYMTCRELSKQDWDIYVLTNLLPNTERRQSCNNVRIIRENLLVKGTRNVFQRMLFYLYSAFFIVRYISRIKPTVVLTQQLIAIPTILLSRLFRIPVIVIVRDYWPICYYRSLLKPNLEICTTYDHCLEDVVVCARNSMKRHAKMANTLSQLLAPPYSLLISAHSLLTRFTIKRSNAFIVVSNFVKRALTSNGVPPQKIHVIYNPIDTNKSQSTATSPPSILFVGSLELPKGVQNIVKAMPKVRERVRNARLFVVGAGPEKERLKRLIKELHVENSVQLLGRISNDHLTKLYRSCSMVVVPSIWPEPFGRVVAEALSHGKPVVASNIGGIPELVDQNSGILVPPNDESALADAVVSLLTGKEAAKLNPCPNLRFSPQTIAAQYGAVITSAIRCKPATSK